MTASKNDTAHTPPLGFTTLTPFYDAAIALMTREKVWRRALVGVIESAGPRTVIDVGSGTGSLAVLLLGAAPAVNYVGVDPDKDAVEIARSKAKRLAVGARFVEGRFPDALGDERADAIVSSLVLHQVPLQEKRRIMEAAFERLIPGGAFIIADYGEQRTLISRLLFRATVQALDGRENTQWNADGVLPRLMKEAGFLDIAETARLTTATGTIAVLSGTKSVK